MIVKIKMSKSDELERLYQINRIEEDIDLIECFGNENLLISIDRSVKDYNIDVCITQDETNYLLSALIGKNQEDIDQEALWIESLQIFTDSMILLKEFH